MSARVLLPLAFCGCLAAMASSARGADVVAQLFPLTGEVRLTSVLNEPLNFILYQIDSPSGALNPDPSVWISIVGHYDASGNGFIDPDFDWLKISPTSEQLTEGAFFGPGGTLPPLRSITLGNIWDPAVQAPHDLVFDIVDSGGESANVVVQLAVAGDYNGDLVVDAADYTRWRDTLGSTTALTADGNLSGSVDTPDFGIWHDNFGAAVVVGPMPFSMIAGTGTGSLALAIATVPEPTAGAIILMAVAAGLIARRQRRY